MVRGGAGHDERLGGRARRRQRQDEAAVDGLAAASNEAAAGAGGTGHREQQPAGNVVLDLFLGSGSTLIACERTGRVCYGMEIDPHYCRIVIARWEAFSGEKAKCLE